MLVSKLPTDIDIKSYGNYVIKSGKTKSVLSWGGNISTENCPEIWLRGLDLNQRPFGYEPNELPDCSTPWHSLIVT